MTDMRDAELLRKQLDFWSSGLLSEVHFWSNWVQTGGGHWPDDFRARLNPNTLIRDYIAELITRSCKSSVRLLDVGSGPITNIGHALPGIDVQIEAVDPLSAFYSKILAERNLMPPTSTRFATAEDLSSFFGEDYFDIVHCCNALDHSIDPLRGLFEMVQVTKIGGTVQLLHHENEAVMENYGGMHQHNFTVRNERFVIWNRDGEIDVAEAIGNAVDIEANLYGETLSPLVKRGVSVTISKRASTTNLFTKDYYRSRVSSSIEAICSTLIRLSLDGKLK